MKTKTQAQLIEAYIDERSYTGAERKKVRTMLEKRKPTCLRNLCILKPPFYSFEDERSLIAEIKKRFGENKCREIRVKLLWDTDVIPPAVEELRPRLWLEMCLKELDALQRNTTKEV